MSYARPHVRASVDRSNHTHYAPTGPTDAVPVGDGGDQGLSEGVGECSPNATTRPLNMPISHNRRRVKIQSDTTIFVFDAAKHCHYGMPKHTCRNLQLGESLFCRIHACQALNADGNRCVNLVDRPHLTVYCDNGWHWENHRHQDIEDLHIRRQQVNENEAERQVYEHLYHVNLFSSLYPSSSGETSSSTSNILSWSSSDISKEKELLASPAKKGETGWGAHGVDKWWEGQWQHTKPAHSGKGL